MWVPSGGGEGGRRRGGRCFIVRNTAAEAVVAVAKGGKPWKVVLGVEPIPELPAYTGGGLARAGAGSGDLRIGAGSGDLRGGAGSGDLLGGDGSGDLLRGGDTEVVAWVEEAGDTVVGLGLGRGLPVG